MLQESRLQFLLTKQQRKWEEICYHMEHLEKDPMVLITEIFRGGDLFLAERLKQEGEDVLLEAHEYWMQYVLPAIHEYFAMDDIQLFYNPEVALSPIYIQRGEQTVAHFSPYWRFFETYEVPGRTHYIEGKNRLVHELEELEKELEELYNIAEKPELMGEEDTWSYAKAMFNPKKHKKKMLELCEEREKRVEQIKRELQTLENKMEFAEREYVETSYCVDRIKRKVERWGDFTFIEPNEGEFE